MKKKLRLALMILLAVVFCVSSGLIIYQRIGYRNTERETAEAEELVHLPDLSQLPPVTSPQPDEEEEEASSDTGELTDKVEKVYVDPYADALRNMDFSALREVNSDVLGWILIPDTIISYPIVQGDDNQYYLTHSWKKSYNWLGSIFMECQNSPDFSDFHTIIYGHRMNSSAMFGTLKYYKTQSYWASHPYIYITDDSGTRKYEIYAAYEVSVTGETYQLGLTMDAQKQAFIEFGLENSVIDTGITPTIYDQILTLSTCTGQGHATRWVVQARLEGSAPSDDAQAEQEPAPPENSGEVEIPGDTAPGGESGAPDGQMPDSTASGESAESGENTGETASAPSDGSGSPAGEDAPTQEDASPQDSSTESSAPAEAAEPSA